VRIAVFSNLWPPAFRGGYEIGAAQIVQELRDRGHEVRVWAPHEFHLVPRNGTYQRGSHTPADRETLIDVGLCVFGSLLRYVRRRKLLVMHDLLRAAGARRRYRRALHAFQPECLLAFNPCGVLAPVLDDFAAYARGSGVPLSCYVSDHWLAGWPIGHPVGAGLMKCRRLLADGMHPTVRTLEHFLRRLGWAPAPVPPVDRYYFCSAFIQQLSNANASAAAHKHVTHWGVSNIRDHAVPADHFDTHNPLTLVYAGQIIEHKGLQVLIQALSKCRARHPLVVIGDDQVDYAGWCKRLAERLGVLRQIHFVGKKQPDEMLSFMARTGHVLVMPSVWQEPFSIVVLEGMGIGLPVVASDTGGTPEAIRDGDNGFLFSGGNSHELAAIIDRLDADRTLCRHVGERARQCVLRDYQIGQLVDQLEAQMINSRHDMLTRAA
jgi:glycosyltransferase involved in cell wall biosynthesis